MKPLRAIQYKALFLLATFSMNTVVGFACSMGVDMGFNSKHHSHNSSNQHEDADNHHEHDGNNSHGHQHATASHHHSDNDNNTVSFTSQSEENCCKDFVTGFNSLDKQLAKQNSTQPKITYLSPFIISAFIIDANNAKGYVQHLRIPPREIDFSPPDIRVFIQSFLI
jgi:hypothetical protein